MYELLSGNPGPKTEYLQLLEVIHSEKELISIGCSRTVAVTVCKAATPKTHLYMLPSLFKCGSAAFFGPLVNRTTVSPIKGSP